MTPVKDVDSGICVVGLGAATAIGRTAPASAAAVRAGVAGFVEHPYMIDRNGEPFVVAMAPYLTDDVDGDDRFIALALPAAAEALDAAVGLLPSPANVTVMIGLPAERPGLSTTLVSNLEAKFARGVHNAFRVSQVKCFPTGHAAGLMAIEAACRQLRAGDAEFCLAGGVDCYLSTGTLEWVEECEQLHNPINAWGFIPGEAAGFCLLCSAETAARYGITVLARIAAVATADEPKRIKTETVCIGEGLTKAVQGVLEGLPPDTMINDTICDLNGEAYRADEFGFMLARTSERFVDASDFHAPADCWGDVGAASGPLFITLAVTAARKAYAKGPRTLVWTSSEGGERTAVILHADLQQRGPA